MIDPSQVTYFSDIIEIQAREQGDKPYVIFEERQVSYAEYERATYQAANGLARQEARPGDGVAVVMGNCPEYLFLFYGLPRGGFYSVPVNVSLKGEGLRYVLTHSDVKYLVVDDTLYPRVKELETPLGAIEKVFVRRSTDAGLPPGTLDLEQLLDAPSERPDYQMKPGVITHLMYTSGTTGFPKGVVARAPGQAQGLMALSQLSLQPTDRPYTALPLFHANALILTAGMSMCAGVTFALDRKFSASAFWDRIRHYNATVFNALGAMVPILMKQAEKANDADNPVRLVNTAACPAHLWEAFEKRFGVTIWEGYGAVDGNAILFNFGNAPVGSVGKLLTGAGWKLIDDRGNAVPQGEVGELITKVADEKTGGVEYYKNPEATSSKVRDGWVYSGDLFYADKEDNLYFVDRKADFMRRRGENISSFEVENIVEKHPAVAVCAAFGVPSELGEDEVMIAVQLKPGARLDHQDLIRHCMDNMAHFMVPRYIDVVDEVPRTETLRIQKTAMKKRGVTDRTWDREKQMPDLKPT
jgi:crotonobetaine/carnitine-CoA ligase